MTLPEDRFQFLKAIPIFAGVHADALQELSQHAEELRCPAGTLAVQEGEPGNRMFVIHTGKVEVIKHLGKDTEKQLATLATKDFFGEMCIIECVVRSASVRATEDTLLLGIKAMDLYHLFRKWPDQYAIVILNIARDLSRRLRSLDEHWCNNGGKTNGDGNGNGN